MTSILDKSPVWTEYMRPADAIREISKELDISERDVKEFIWVIEQIDRDYREIPTYWDIWRGYRVYQLAQIIDLVEYLNLPEEFTELIKFNQDLDYRVTLLRKIIARLRDNLSLKELKLTESDDEDYHPVVLPRDLELEIYELFPQIKDCRCLLDLQGLPQFRDEDGNKVLVYHVEDDEYVTDICQD